jgi:AcrR family transcriptional regulator
MPKISDEKRQARQAQILDAATLCFARDGFHRTSMEDIVRESGLSPGAIYCYFRSKQDMVEAISAERHARDQAVLAELASSPNLSEGLDRIARALICMLQEPKERQRRKVSIQFWAESLHDAKIRKVAERGLRQRDLLTQTLRDAQQKGELAETLDADSVSRVIFALLQGFILQQAWEPALDTTGYVTTAMALLRSVLSEAGRSYIRKHRKSVSGAVPEFSSR